MKFGRRKKIDDQPTLTDTNLSVGVIAELAKNGMVYDKVIDSNELPEEAKALVPAEVLDILGPVALFHIVEKPE
jgi:hypothetical protein